MLFNTSTIDRINESIHPHEDQAHHHDGIISDVFHPRNNNTYQEDLHHLYSVSQHILQMVARVLHNTISALTQHYYFYPQSAYHHHHKTVISYHHPKSTAAPSRQPCHTRFFITNTYLHRRHDIFPAFLRTNFRKSTSFPYNAVELV